MHVESQVFFAPAVIGVGRILVVEVTHTRHTGAVGPEQVQANLKLLQHPIPPALWSDLKSEGLLPEDAP